MERASEQKVAPPTVPVATVKPHTVNNKPRKSREHRSRSQEWPDVPDVGKIEEQNPELLAQKILETGRQIEAGKISKPNVIVNGYGREAERAAEPSRHKPAPLPRAPPRPAPPAPPPPAHHALPLRHTPEPAKPQKPLNVVAKVQESPKVINFEDRLKSIITSVLNEDQEQRKATRPAAPAHPYSNGFVRATGAGPYPTRTPAPAASPQGYARAPRDLRRERYPPYERRDTHARAPERLHAHHAHHAPHPPHPPHPQHSQHAPQPDYTQVSPAKLALRRHLSQERLAAPGARTIGDLVNGEIERTLEISNQSIINAAVNMSARYHEPAANNQPLEGLAACLQARVLASEYWRGRNGTAPAPAGAAPPADEDGKRRSPGADPHSNTSTPLVDEVPDGARLPGNAPNQPRARLAPPDRLTPRSVTEGEGGEEVDESKWQDRIAFRFDQIISFASTAMEDKRRRSDEACNTSPDSGIGHGEAGGAAPPAAHFKKRFFRRERWGAWGGAAPQLDWERPPM